MLIWLKATENSEEKPLTMLAGILANVEWIKRIVDAGLILKLVAYGCRNSIYAPLKLAIRQKFSVVY